MMRVEESVLRVGEVVIVSSGIGGTECRCVSENPLGQHASTQGAGVPNRGCEKRNTGQSRGVNVLRLGLRSTAFGRARE